MKQNIEIYLSLFFLKIKPIGRLSKYKLEQMLIIAGVKDSNFDSSHPYFSICDE